MSLTTKEPKEEKKAKVKYAKVIKLTKPLKDLDETITELKFVEMTLDDIMDYSITDLQKNKVILSLTASLTGNRVEVIKKMCFADYFKCIEVITNFFMSSQATSDNS
ncbi:phage tail assembly protein [Silvanigrella aquatica]|uniref:Phage tail assembly protein n=1 Tax=Silvanigrella aquatica TaxID=1915309 RepID=A0A1L4D148_9BACT|nr:phage tail assembly protein [Silvanigrella aquatica]APJ03935.1 hypothetical protein AXG55_08465 [Silvanigrella aquatica]